MPAHTLKVSGEWDKEEVERVHLGRHSLGWLEEKEERPKPLVAPVDEKSQGEST